MTILPQSIHPLVIIPFAIFKQQSLGEKIGKNFIIPPRHFPPNIFLENDNYIASGYFANYDKRKNLDIEKILSDAKWKELANLDADFLIFYWNIKKSELCVLTDQSGKFPCYFCCWENNLIVSTDLPFLINLRNCSLNLDLALDYITTGLFTFIYDETLVKEINQIPPGTLLRVSQPPNFKLESQVDLKSFVDNTPAPYASNEVFSKRFLATLDKSVKKRLKILNNLNFGAELSSGLDSGLICYLLKKASHKDFYCYTNFTQEVETDTNRDLVKKFCQKHGLSVFFDKVDEYFPFNKKRYLKIFRKYPPSLTGIELAYKSFEFARKKGSTVYFQGLGGDEVFKTQVFDFWLDFRIQDLFFMTALRFKLGIDKVLTPSGLKYLISEERFDNRRIYPNIFSTSAINANLSFFPIAWEKEVWPITPFVDSEIVQFTRLKMPRHGLIAPDKREILASLEAVFIEEQFRKKLGDEKLFDQFLIKKSEFIINVLKNSILDKTGWFRTEEIIKNLEMQRIESYLIDDTSFYLEYLVRLEYFLQNNNVKIRLP